MSESTGTEPFDESSGHASDSHLHQLLGQEIPPNAAEKLESVEKPQTKNPDYHCGPFQDYDCGMVEEHLWEIIHHDLAPSLLAPLQAHLKECPHCAAQSAELEKIVTKLQASCHC